MAKRHCSAFCVELMNYSAIRNEPVGVLGIGSPQTPIFPSQGPVLATPLDSAELTLAGVGRPMTTGFGAVDE